MEDSDTGEFDVGADGVGAPPCRGSNEMLDVGQEDNQVNARL